MKQLLWVLNEALPTFGRNKYSNLDIIQLFGHCIATWYAMSRSQVSFDSTLYVPVNNLSVMSGRVFLG